jgi:hypothetical protein
VPKIFHRIWLGNTPMPLEFVRYGETWEDNHPCWEMKLWTDENLPKLINEDYLKLCKNYSEMSDLIRYELLYKYGGVYIDTDFESLKPIDNLIEDLDIFASTENNTHICGGFFGAQPKHPLLKEIINKIPQALEENKNETSDLKIGPTFITEVLKYSNIKVLDKEFFYPYLPGQTSIKNKLSENKIAYAAHHWAASWLEKDIKKSPKKVTRKKTVRKHKQDKVPSLSIVIPYREDVHDPKGIRRKNYEFVLKRYKELFPRAEIVIGRDNKGDEIHFCRATAINDGVKRSKSNTIVISDGDLIIKDRLLKQAIEEVEKRGFIIPWGRCYDITESLTQNIIRTKKIDWKKARKDELKSVRDIRHDKMAGGIQVVLKTVFNKVGGYDEEFYGWGYEDTDFCRRIIKHLGNYPIYKGGEIIHLWHPRSYPNLQGNRELYNKKHPEHAK